MRLKSRVAVLTAATVISGVGVAGFLGKVLLDGYRHDGISAKIGNLQNARDTAQTEKTFCIRYGGDAEQCKEVAKEKTTKIDAEIKELEPQMRNRAVALVVSMAFCVASLIGFLYCLGRRNAAKSKEAMAEILAPCIEIFHKGEDAWSALKKDTEAMLAKPGVEGVEPGENEPPMTEAEVAGQRRFWQESCERDERIRAMFQRQREDLLKDPDLREAFEKFKKGEKQ